MSSHKQRLDSAIRPLDAKARALLALKALKAGETPDTAIMSTMARQDEAEFRRLLGLVGATSKLPLVIFALESSIPELELRLELVSTRRELGTDIRVLGDVFRASTKEPITESAYQALREALMPIDDLVEITFRRDAVPTDANDVDETGEPALSDDESTDTRAEIRSHLIELFRDGKLTGEEDEAGINIRAGEFYDWLGDPQPVVSNAGYEYDVLPDELADVVVAELRTRRLAEQLIAWAPGREDLPLDLEGELPDLSDDTVCVVMDRMSVKALRDGIQAGWRQLRGVEIVAAAVADEFYGEDRLPVEARDMLQGARDRLLALAEKVQRYAGIVTLSDPDAAYLAQFRRTIQLRATQS